MDHFLLVALIIPLAFLIYHSPHEQRSWSFAAGGLAWLTSAVAPAPVPVLIVVMALSGVLAIRAERFNPTSVRWTTVRGLALYSLAGIGFTLYQDFIAASIASPLLVQGQVYISTMAGFAVYLIPLAFLAMLAQSLWAHPPVPGRPADLIRSIRSRGKGA
jgi:hypothetical protein